MTEALVGLAFMMVLALLRIPIAVSMGVIGFLGVAYLRDWNFAPALAMVETKVYETGRNYTLSVVPLFILMGNLVTRAGMSQELFRAAYTCIGHLRGGLAMATVCACAGFGAICGRSSPTAATTREGGYPAPVALVAAAQMADAGVGGAEQLLRHAGARDEVAHQDEQRHHRKRVVASGLVDFGFDHRQRRSEIPIAQIGDAEEADHAHGNGDRNAQQR